MDTSAGTDSAAAGDVDIEHRHLRRAIEFAVEMAAELLKRRRSVKIPREVRAQVGVARIPTGALGRLRRAIDHDDEFRRLVASGAIPELVDPIGILWLQRPSGWRDAIIAEVTARTAEEDERDIHAAVRREEKRRRAAEAAAARSRADLVVRDELIGELREHVEVLRTDLVKAGEEIAEVRAELVDVRNEARHARDRERAATDKLAVLNAERARTDETHEPDATDAASSAGPPAVDLAALAELMQTVRQVADRAEALLSVDDEGPPQPRPPTRTPLRLPGGVIATSAEAAEFLLRSDAAVLVDGYNVAKLAWPSRPLEAQRSRLLDALENAARRFGTDITVVFDGADVVGAHTSRRRLLRVVYSPEGVIADDVIRDEVRRLPASRGVVVVTNDAEIVTDVRVLGANVVPSNALLGVI